jgi:DNA-binding NarL/FixJ family response regulator
MMLGGDPRRTVSSRIRVSGRKKLSMEVYERETEEIVKRFLAYRLDLPECITALDAALAYLIPRLTGDQLPRLRIAMLANNEIVMKEMERRVKPDPSSDRPVNLTPRQLEIALLVGQGSSSEEIGARLNLTAKTVECHRREIEKVTGVKGAVLLVRYLIREGLLKP